jgi:peptide/nickel transport system substrate-binding protein
MKNSRAVVFTALVTGAALVLAACSSPGQSTTTTSAPTTGGAAASSPADTATASSAAESPAPSGSESASSSAAASSGATPPSEEAGACGTPHGAYDDPGAAAGQLTYGYNELATSWNNLTTHSNSTYNGLPLYMTQAQPFYYDKDLNLVNNDSFIKCEFVSKDPLTIKYTINKDAKWSDGVPVTADDLLLPWIALSGKFSTEEIKTDENGVPLPPKGVAFDGASAGLALVKDFPVISDDNLSITFKYSEPYVDFAVNVAPGVAAHVVGQHALGVSDPTAANAAIIKAAKDNDEAALKKIATFWNTGFDFTSLPSDKSLYLSNGAYLMTDFKEGQYMTLEANPDYTWGPKPTVKTFTIQYAPDPTAAVQSLANGELQIINPQATEDVLKGVTALKDQGIETINGNAALWEHVDLVFTNGGPFDPKTYGGDEAKAQAVRTAFLKTIPRQDIVDRLIVPLNPDAKPRNSYNVIPGSPSYDSVVAANGMTAAHDGDVAAAKKILADAGVDTAKPIDVRLMYADNNPRRANEYRLIASSAKEAGFNVIDGKNAKWSSLLPNTKVYDASLFAWISTSTGAGQIPPNYLGKIDGKWAGANNYGQYNNADVNKWMTELNVTTDPAKQLDLITKTETQLVKDGFGTTLFNHPDIVAYDSTKVTGVEEMALSPSPLHNYWEWKLTG